MGRSGPHEITDLSATGAFICTEKPPQFKRDDQIDLVLKLPTAEEAMVLKAQIVRFTANGIGVKFTELTPDFTKVIEDCYNAFKHRKPQKDRRHAPRTAFRLEVEVWGRSGPHEITDFSATGAFIRTEKPPQFRPDDQIDLVLKLPTEEEAMLLKAQITRFTADGMGVKFTKLTPDSTKVIEDCYNAFKHRKPQGDD